MINYVIINGVNSNTKNGLMINELPPISKPQMRTDIEEIDGRDGDIITKLGYSAYDKTITIGLWGTSYDVNDIIAFFNKEGIITFSNEPDKYYKFTMLDDFDIETLLRFKTASITFHCQPYKYPTEETPIELEYEFIEQDNAESATLNNTNGDSHLDITLKGNTSQYTTTGKNKWNILESLSGTSVSTNDNEVYELTASTQNRTYTIDGEANTAYTLSFTMSGSKANIAFYWKYSDNTTTWITEKSTDNPYTMTVNKTSDSSKTLVGINVITYGSSIYPNYTFTQPMIETGSTKTDFEPYTNGASPNPNYPQQIHEVSGDNEVVVCGKNLLDISEDNSSISGGEPIVSFFENGFTMSGSQGSQGGAVWFYVPTKVATVYTLTIKTNGNFTNIRTYKKDKSTLLQNLTDILTSGEHTKTLNATTEDGFYIRFWRNYDSGIATLEYAMLNEGSTALPYEPYNGDTYELNLGVENLFGTSVLQGAVDINSVATSTTRLRTNDFIAVKPNTNYVCSFKGNANDYDIHCFTSNEFPRSSEIGWKSNGTYFTTPSTCNYIMITFRKSDNSTITTDDISNIQLEEGTKANSYSPFGQTPIKMRGIGSYEDYFTKNTGKNLVYSQLEGKNIDNTGQIINQTGFNLNIARVVLGQTYTTSKISDLSNWDFVCAFYESEPSLGSQSYNSSRVIQSKNSTFIAPITGYVAFRSDSGISNIQLEKGNSSSTYEPYGTGQWCKYNAIKKEVYDGTESWTEIGTRYSLDLTGYSSGVIPTLCNSFLSALSWASHTTTDNTVILYKDSQWQTARLSFNYSSAGSLNNWKTWLGNNKPIIYYPLATPYLSLIEDTTLINQLDNLEYAMSYEGQTNVSQVNNDKAFIMDLIAIKDGTDEVEVNNIGNTYSKPTIALEGTGDINIYLNGTQMLKATLTDKMTIDTTNLEAYNPDTMTLLNRQLVGDISKFTLSSGNNTIKVDGNLTKATITDYVRYL